MIHIQLAEDVMEYIYDVQADKKKEKKTSVVSITSALNSIVRDHMAIKGYIPKSKKDETQNSEPSA